MTVRHLTLAFVLAFGMAVASPMHALADDCPNSDNPETCAEVTTSPDGTDGAPGAPDMTVPTVDANGDPIPYVEETTAPPPVTSLVPDAAGQ